MPRAQPNTPPQSHIDTQRQPVHQRRYAMLDVARRLGTSHFRLFRLARDAGMLDRNNWPTRQAVDAGLFIPRSIEAHEHGRAFVRSSAVATAAGICWLNRQLHGDTQPDPDPIILSRPVIGRLLGAAQSLLHHTATGTGEPPVPLLEALEQAVTDTRAELDTNPE